MEITEELVSQNDIMEYSKKNTSPKMPIEQKYVFSFLNSLLNSTSVKLFYQELSDQMQGGEAFVGYRSYFNSTNLVDSSLRHIVTYSMLKKDMRLFELISQELFTGSVQQYHGLDLAGKAVETTDESPLRYTDESITTDMLLGLVIIGFKNFYCNDPPSQENRYQTQEELEESIKTFDTLITLTKPAWVEIFLFHVPWCFLSGNATEITSSGINTEWEYFQAPFGDPDSMAIIDNYSDYELMKSYSQVDMYKIDNDVRVDYMIDVQRTVRQGDGYITMDYDIKYHYDLEDRTDDVWKIIDITSNESAKNYIKAKAYYPDEVYFEKYVPIMLRINDNDPDGPCLAFQIENDVPTIGAMFYTREKAD